VTAVRVAAARVLLAVEAGHTTLGAELARAREDLSPVDKALLVELATGTLRWRNALDVYVAAASRRSVARIDARALAVLRLGAYQLTHLERIPDHAVVHESVEAVRDLGAPRAAGFVNASLRALIRRRHAVALPRRPGPDATRDAQVRYLSVTLSHPAWLVSRWIDRLGFEEAESRCLFNDDTPAVTVRPLGGESTTTLLAAIEAEGLEAAPAPYVADAIRLPPGALGRLSADLQRRLQVQDEGAQLVARMVGAAPGERILDACAAPGGKTLVMAADMHLPRDPTSRLVAMDLRPGRVALLVETLRRARLPLPVVRADVRRPLPFGAIFDAVVLDAPCSGLGTIRRDPDVKWSRRAEDLAQFAVDQQLMLEVCVGAVRPGGRLVYATCSSEREENQDVVQAFLTRHPEFRPVAPPAQAGVPAALLTPEGWLSTRPGEHALEGFFAAVLERRTDA
jgi:16S rRNA (cytosine967-C5)-methyltransferase